MQAPTHLSSAPVKVTDEEADRWTTRGLRAAGEALIARIYRGWLRGGRRERKGAHCLAQIRDIGRLRVALFVVDTRHVGSVCRTAFWTPKKCSLWSFLESSRHFPFLGLSFADDLGIYLRLHTWDSAQGEEEFSSVQFLRGPPTLTPPSQRTAPLPSVNTSSTEYSLARVTQLR